MLNYFRTHFQARIIVIFALGLLVPTAIVATYSVNASVNAIIAATNDHELTVAEQTVSTVDEFLARMKGDLLFLHNDPGTKDFAAVLAGQDDPAALPDLIDLFSNFLTNSPHQYKDIRVLNTSGQEVLRVDASDGEPVVIPNDQLENKANRPYFQEAIKLAPDEVYFSGLDLNVTNGQIDNPPVAVLRYSVPLYTESGQVVGVMVLKSLASEILDELKPDEASEKTYLVDQQGNYWLNPYASKLYGSLLGTGVSFSKDQPQDAATMSDNSQGVLQATSERPDDLQTFIQIPLEDQPGEHWTLINVRPEAEITGHINQARLTMTVIGLVSALVAMAITGYFGQAALVQIVRLTTAAREIAQNRWDTPLPEVKGEDEIASLTNSFRTMTQAVRSRNEQLTKLNETLTGQTRDLTRANAIAKESIRLKSEFMSTMSHELRTPLNAILGFSGIMLQGMGGEMDEEAHHMVERIEANSQRLLHLINDVLDLAKIEAGRMELVQQPFSPLKLSQRWISDTSVLAEKKGLKVVVNIDPTLPETLIGDSERITQIGINLLSNAIKFTSQGSVTLSLDKQAETWTIKVADTGIGIPPHALSYIFDEFRQVDGTSTRAFGGSGLGLSIARNLSRMMDGTIQVTSELGKGSVFTVTLPLTLPEPSHNGAHAPVAQPV